MRGIPRVLRWALGACLAAVVVVLGAGPAAGAVSRAAPSPPDIRGLTVAEARDQLLTWSKSVNIQFVPDPQQLPAGVDPSTVVVVDYAWLNSANTPPTAVAAVRPQVRVDLGTRMPDLAGLELPDATKALTSRGLVLRASPAPVPSGWVVRSQGVPAQTLVPFGRLVDVGFAAVPRPLPWLMIAIAGGGGLLLVALVLATLSLRRARRRRRAERQDLPETQNVHVQAYRGQIVGPDLIELQEQRR